MPKPISIEQINAMSKEEVQALNAKLGRQVIINFGTRMFVKWALIIGAVHLTNKVLDVKFQSQPENVDARD